KSKARKIFGTILAIDHFAYLIVRHPTLSSVISEYNSKPCPDLFFRMIAVYICFYTLLAHTTIVVGMVQYYKFCTLKCLQRLEFEAEVFQNHQQPMKSVQLEIQKLAAKNQQLNRILS